MVQIRELRAQARIEIKSVKVETPSPADGFTDPMVWIYTSGEVFTERVSDILMWFCKNKIIKDFDQMALEVNPGTGWVSTFNWIFSGLSPIQDPEVIGRWVSQQLARREKSKKAIEFFIHES